MKHRLHIFSFLTLAVLLPTISWSQEGTSDVPLPKVHIIATGGTIAGTSNEIGYDAVLITHGTDTMEETAFKNDTHSPDPIAETSADWYLPHNADTGFFVDNLKELPEVGIVYGYGSNSTVAFEAFVNAGYKGIVFAGVGDGNLNQATLDLAAKAVKSGVMIVRSSRIPFGGVYTEGGEVDDEKLGFIASGSLSPQKSRILLMLALTATRDIGVIRSYFRQGAFTYAVELPGVSNARQLGGYIIGDKKSAGICYCEAERNFGINFLKTDKRWSRDKQN